MGQRGGVRKLILMGEHGQLGSEAAHSLPQASLSQISLRFPEVSYAPSPELGTAYIFSSYETSQLPGEGLNVQTWKLRHGELRLDKNVALLPNPSHPGFYLCSWSLTWLLLPTSKTRPAAFSEFAELRLGPLHTLRSLPGTPHETTEALLRWCQAGLSSLCTEATVPPVLPHDSSEGGHSITQKKKALCQC